MKKLIAAIGFALLAACGGGSNGGRDTLYHAPPATLFATAKSVTEGEHYHIVKDDGQAHMETEAIWYTPDGQIDTTTGNNISRLQEDSINLAFNIDVKASGDGQQVVVSPQIHRKHGLTSLPEAMDPDDPQLPGWVHGKVVSLQSKIHDSLAQFAAPSGPAPESPAARSEAQPAQNPSQMNPPPSPQPAR